MTVNAPNPGLYTSQLGNHCVALRNALNDLLNDSAYLASMGGTVFLEAAPMNLAPADATVVMNTVGAVIPTNAVVQALQAFIATTEPLWGGA